ncbi:YrhK family protein [Amycolatopsis sp. NPDC023774]|uniref:YrhK family protein n=1 Tax=Amycolatopsis sp. NPDC023774 TaxID=3155015 RepID=UPI0033D264DB
MLRFGHGELIIRERYEVLSIANDLIALWFVAGSVLFFSESLSTLATWFVLISSVELLIRSGIRPSRSAPRPRPRCSSRLGRPVGHALNCRWRWGATSRPHAQADRLRPVFILYQSAREALAADAT